MTRVIPALAVLWFIGCAKHPVAAALETHPSTWWQTTGSPCSDAMQINMIAEGCTQINTNIIENKWAEFRCADNNEGQWSQSWWLFTPTGLELISGHTPVCLDLVGTLAIRDQ